ncbi:hypothetical protein [Ruminococcus flavefaciens]|uniref:hypothetical protein n=1 Tax=Ruminococcus flavefaciens TaxID=1265 RepID=UPI0018AFF07B|nr:hypothetical protein [Ruminococcus flavefaciens]
MNEFIIMVAIENDVTLQEHICNISLKRIEQGKWPVKILFWDDIVHSIKSDQTMLRLYYPELYQGHIEVLAEASMDACQKYPTIIQNAHELRKLFFTEAVAQRIEEFLECDPTYGIPLDLTNSANVCVYAIRKLFQRSPMLIDSNSYALINAFLNSLNKYHTANKESDIKEVEKLRKEVIEKYEEIKEESLI